MDAPVRATPEFKVRDRQRLWLFLHFTVMVLGLGGAAFLNRMLTPNVFWVTWVAIAWGAIFLVHVVIFALVTVASLGMHNPT